MHVGLEFRPEKPRGGGKQGLPLLFLRILIARRFIFFIAHSKVNIFF